MRVRTTLRAFSHSNTVAECAVSFALTLGAEKVKTDDSCDADGYFFAKAKQQNEKRRAVRDNSHKKTRPMKLKVRLNG